MCWSYGRIANAATGTSTRHPRTCLSARTSAPGAATARRTSCTGSARTAAASSSGAPSARPACSKSTPHRPSELSGQDALRHPSADPPIGEQEPSRPASSPSGTGPCERTSHRRYAGGTTYRLHVDPDPPAKNFWAVDVYDTQTRSLIQVPSTIHPAVASNTGMLQLAPTARSTCTSAPRPRQARSRTRSRQSRANPGFRSSGSSAHSSHGSTRLGNSANSNPSTDSDPVEDTSGEKSRTAGMPSAELGSHSAQPVLQEALFGFAGRQGHCGVKFSSSLARAAKPTQVVRQGGVPLM